jgi:hypothetical protein
MEILKFEGGAPRGRAKSSSNKKTIRVAVAVGAVALVAVLSSTLAANITINSGSSVEFGQGIAGAAACDGSLTITPQSTFSNGSGSAGTFYFGSIKVSDATTNSTSGLALCNGKYIKLAAYDSATATPLTITTSPSSTSTTQSVEVLIGATNSSGLAVVTVPTGAGATISTTSQSFTVNLGYVANVTATAGQVYKITVESHS